MRSILHRDFPAHVYGQVAFMRMEKYMTGSAEVLVNMKGHRNAEETEYEIKAISYDELRKHNTQPHTFLN